MQSEGKRPQHLGALRHDKYRNRIIEYPNLEVLRY